MTWEKLNRIRKASGKLSFAAWLEDQYGVSESYWDNNYPGDQQDAMMDEYEEYVLN